MKYLFINDKCYIWGYGFYLIVLNFPLDRAPQQSKQLDEPIRIPSNNLLLAQNGMKTACSRCNWFCFSLVEKLTGDLLANRYMSGNCNHEITFHNHSKPALTTMTICCLQKWKPARSWSEFLKKKKENWSWQLSIAFILSTPSYAR